MEQLQKEMLFSMEEAAKWCGMSRNAFYMRYRRGQVKPVPMLSHRLYFTREEIDNFRANYKAF